MKSVFFYFCIFIYLSFGSVLASQIEDMELPVIVKEGSAGEILLEDEIVPAQRGQTNLSSGVGSVQNSIQNQVSVPFSDSGRPGNRAQVRGLGPSSEEVDVQVFGISLNPPHGGGFDLSVFPQFLWSDFQFQVGPSLNALNQTSAAGTLSLTPWTIKALDQPGARGWKAKGVGFSSSSGINQVSASAWDGKNFAVISGYSSLKAVGPSAGLSGRWKTGAYTGSFHLLASDIDSETTGTTDYPTPLARMRSQRWIPVLQNDFQIAPSHILKVTTFYDFLKLDYRDPGNSWLSKDTIQQWGIESVYRAHDWKVGLSARQVSYFMDSSLQVFKAPLQSIGNIQVSRSIGWANSLLEPTFQGIWVTGFGFLPQGSLGFRQEWGQHLALYSRATFSRRIPSLLDRYYVFNNFVGNANLKAEQDWTGIIGGEYRSKTVESSLQVYGQFRQDAQVLQGNSISNLNHAYILSVMGKATAFLTPQLDWSNSITFSHSRILATGFAFPYVSPWMGVSGLSIHSKQNPRNWEWATNFRFQGSRVYDPVKGNQLPGFGVVDVGFSFALNSAILLAGRVENVLDRPIELIHGLPLGRTFSVTLSGQI
jgi:hypothetical protein